VVLKLFKHNTEMRLCNCNNTLIHAPDPGMQNYNLTDNIRTSTKLTTQNNSRNSYNLPTDQHWAREILHQPASSL